MRSRTTLSSIPITIQQNPHPIVVQLEDDVLSSIPKETHLNEPIPVVKNLEKTLSKNITGSSEF